MKRKYLLSMSMAAILLLTGISVGQGAAQTPSSASAQSATDQDIELLRKDLRSQKKQIIAANIQLTEAEAVKFWPLYDQYASELTNINNAKYGAIKEYAASYDTLTDDQATRLIRQIIGVDQSVAQLRLKYVPIIGKVISGKKTALFFQVDRRLTNLIDLQLAAQLPVVQP